MCVCISNGFEVVSSNTLNHLNILYRFFSASSKHMSTDIEAIQREVETLREKLRVSEEELSNQYQIIECLCYVTALEQCDICFECMTNPAITWIMLTACGHRVCTNCWGAMNTTPRVKRVVHMRCPWNSCIQLDEVGAVILGIDGNSIVSACSIGSKYSRNHLLHGINNVFLFLKKIYSGKITPDVFDRHIPKLLVEYVKSLEPLNQT